MINYLTEHSTTVLFICYIICSTAISSLAPPRAAAGPFYQWFYKFANALAANVSALRGKVQYEEPPKITVVADGQ
jgi:hypothetical protein